MNCEREELEAIELTNVPGAKVNRLLAHGDCCCGWSLVTRGSSGGVVSKLGRGGWAVAGCLDGSSKQLEGMIA